MTSPTTVFAVRATAAALALLVSARLFNTVGDAQRRKNTVSRYSFLRDFVQFLQGSL